MQNRTIKNNLVYPMKDKKRLMKMEHLLSNNYVLLGLIIIIDLAVFMGMNYLTHIFASIPPLLLQQSTVSEMFSPRYLFVVTLPTFLGFVMIAAVLDVVLIFRIKISWSEDYFNVGQKGTERFMTEEEIKEEYKAIDPVDTPYPGNPGIVVSRIGNRFYIDDNVVNNLIIGITRSGKGELFAKPGIEIYSRAQFQPSLIVNDPKLEHYKVFKSILEERGYEVYLLNTSNPKLSMGFNLLSLPVQFYKRKDYDTAEMVTVSIAHALFNVDQVQGEMVYFTNSAADLFVAMVLAGIGDAIMADELENQKRYEQWCELSKEIKKEHPFQYRYDNEKTINLYSMIVNFGQMVTRPITKDGSRTLLDQFFEERQSYDRARMKYLGVEIAPGKTKSSVFSEMLREISIFSLQDVARMTAESTLELEEIGFGKKPIAVFLATPSYDSSLYKLPTIFIRQVYYVLGKKCDDGKGKCDRQVKVILDETGNMPEIDLMKVMTTMGLGQNISFDLYLQNYEQLDTIYGKDVSETIKGNCGNHIFLQTQSRDTAKEFAGKLGNKSVIDVQRAGGKLSWNKYFTESIQEHPLLDENQLMDFLEGECAIVRRSKRKDLKGKKVKPQPIFNSVENGHYLWYSYEYFPEDRYPNPNDINFLDICDESRMHIKPKELIWDLKKSWEMLRMLQQRLITLEDIGYSQLIPLLKKSFGEHFEAQYQISEEMTIAELASFVQKQQIPEAEKETIMNHLLGGGKEGI